MAVEVIDRRGTIDVPDMRRPVEVDTRVRPFMPTAQLGLVSAAVEVHDPSGILTVAEDLEDGSGVRLGLAQAGVASPTPDLGVGLSWPLEDIAGRRITEIGDFLIEGYSRLLLVANPQNFGGPSRMWVGVGVTADGPLSVATRGIVFGIRNTAAGQWQCQLSTRSGGAWAAPLVASGGLADPGGLHGVWGGPALSAAQTFGESCAPLQGASGITAVRVFTAVTLVGADPHLVLCAGWADVPPGADQISIRAGGRYHPPPRTGEV